MSTTPRPLAPDDALAAHVLQGLRSTPKALSSAWLYDDEGSRLFERIMALPEYYLTRAEHRVLERDGDALAAALSPSGRPVELVELGSGNGAKTLLLCEALERRDVDWLYRPIDLSGGALDALLARFARAMPHARVQPLPGDFLQRWPERERGRRRVAMLMGSSLGNLARDEAVALLRALRTRLETGDALVLGLDLQKDPRVVLAAYDDAQGVTARFNLNLLARLNRELAMDFDLDAFAHYPTYSPLDGAALSFLVSTRRQTVRSERLGCAFSFDEGETIFMERSQKYGPALIEDLSRASGFVPWRRFVDERDRYAVEVWHADTAAAG
ncbi:MAG TPA: L-histidine N(alpha)-methyltransferase [Burkholderiaceae bacterium]|nr:L-histidine N(alpha)-methyltransferase [Burkholderiaceae bacterium]